MEEEGTVLKKEGNLGASGETRSIGLDHVAGLGTGDHQIVAGIALGLNLVGAIAQHMEPFSVAAAVGAANNLNCLHLNVL